MKEFNNIMVEFAKIMRGEHLDYKGDRRYNGGFFLYSLVKADAVKAKDIAWDIECNIDLYMILTNLPERTLVQAQRVLYGQTCQL